MAQIQKGTTYITGDQVTAANLNALADSAILLAGAITDQTAKTVPLAADTLLIHSAADTALRKSTLTQVFANATGIPISTGISGLGTGVATFLGTPSSANLASALTDETGSGAAVFATSPTLVTPILGTPTSGTLTSCTGLPISTGVSGLGTGIATALAVNVGTAGAPVVNGGALGTPSSGTVTNLTGTASININGTVGATTPSTVAATTLSASGVLSLNSTSYHTVNSLNFLRSAGGYNVLYAGTNGLNINNQADTAGIAAFTSTGLAVTGALSATGQLTVTGAAQNPFGSAFTPTAWGSSSIDINHASGGILAVYHNGTAKGYLAANSGTAAISLNTQGDGTITNNVNGTARATISSTGLAVNGALSSTTGANFATSSGNVGIGTASPAYKLDILEASNSFFNGIQVRNSSSGSSATASIALAQDTNLTAAAFFLNSSTNSGFGGANSLNILNGLNAPIVFHTNGANERMRIDSAGNVGIGVTNPLRKLSLPDDAYIGFGVGNGTRPDFQIGHDDTGGYLGIRAGFGADTVDVAIDSNGNVGIGTTNQFGGGVQVVGLANATTVPASNPTGGGVLYVESGALKFRGSSGTVTTIANA